MTSFLTSVSFQFTGVILQLEETHNTTATEGESVLICVKMLGRADFAIHALLRPVGTFGSAQRGVDFTGAEQAVLFPAVSSEHQCVSVQVIDDNAAEQEEEFQVELVLAQEIPSVTLGASRSVSITILDNDCKYTYIHSYLVTN